MSIIKEKNEFGLKLASFFMPHSIGHFVGLDVHDFAPDMVVTCEPGLYFNSDLLEQLAGDKELGILINWKVVESYFKVGGVRIEDCLRITKDDPENLTRAVKEVDDVENMVQGWL